MGVNLKKAAINKLMNQTMNQQFGTFNKLNWPLSKSLERMFILNLYIANEIINIDLIIYKLIFLTKI